MVGSIKKPGTYERVKPVSGVVGKGGGVYAPTGENLSTGEVSEEQAKQILQKQIEIRQAGGTGYVPEGGYLSMYETKEVPKEVPQEVKQGYSYIDRSTGRGYEVSPEGVKKEIIPRGVSRGELQEARVGKIPEEKFQTGSKVDLQDYYNKYKEVLEGRYTTTKRIIQEDGTTVTIKNKEIPQLSRTNKGEVFARYKSGERILLEQEKPFYVNQLEVQPAQTTKQRLISYFKPEGEKFGVGTILSTPVRTIRAISGELQRAEDIRQQKFNDFYQSESMLTIAEKLPYASYFTPAGSVLIASSGAERLTTPSGKQQLNQIGTYLESKGLPSSLKYAVPIGEIGLGAIGIRSQLKTLANIKQVAQNTPVGEITTKTISTNRQKISNIIMSDKDLQVMLKNERISGSRIYETTIPVKEGTKRILWIEQSSAKGNIGRRNLVGVEISPEGKVVAKLGGVSIEKVNEKGVSNLLTEIVRETKGKRLILSPTEERQLLTYAEEIKPVAVKNIGRNVRATISQSESSLIGQEDVLGLVRKELEAKKNLFFEGRNIPIRPESGTKSIMKEVTLLNQPELVIAKQKFGTGSILSIRAEQKGISIGVEEALKKPIRISIKSIPSETESIGKLKQVTKQITKQQLNKPSGFAQVFAQTKTTTPKSSMLPMVSATDLITKTEAPSKTLGENMFSATAPTGKIESLSIDKTKDLGVMSSRFDILTKVEEKVQTIQKPIITIKTKQETKQQTNKEQILSQVTKQNQELLQQPKQEQSLLQKQNQLQLQLQKQIQLQKLKTKLTSRFKQPTKQPTKFKTPPPPPIIFDLGKALSKVKKISESETFEVFGKRFGKDIKLLETTSPERAEEKALEFLKGTLGRSAKITKGGKALEFKALKLSRNIEFRPAKRESTRIVQKAKYSLGTGAEVKEIQYFKRKRK